MRFFFVDRVLSLDENIRIEGLKNWTLSDDVFQDHFPGFPVVPGVLLIESMAQLLGILIHRSFRAQFPERDEDVYALLSLVHNASFNKFVRPGDQTRLTGMLKTMDLVRAMGEVIVNVEGEKRAKAELTFLLVPESRLEDDAVSHQRKYFEILTREMSKHGDIDQ